MIYQNILHSHCFMSQNACVSFPNSEQHTTFKESMINRLSNLINRNRSAAKISQVFCSRLDPTPKYGHCLAGRRQKWWTGTQNSPCSLFLLFRQSLLNPAARCAFCDVFYLAPQKILTREMCRMCWVSKCDSINLFNFRTFWEFGTPPFFIHCLGHNGSKGWGLSAK